MKTTIEIPDALLQQIKREARKRKTTMKAVIVDTLRRGIAQNGAAAKPFKLRDGSFRGTGPAPGVDLDNWSQIRDIIYEGRGS